MGLRDYQQDALDNVIRLYKSGTNRMLGHAFTGGGKTHIALHIPEVLRNAGISIVEDHGLLFIAHRREILFQAYNKFRRMYPDKWCGIEMGDYHATGFEDFVFVSVDSVGRIMSNRLNTKYKERMFGAIIADEGHHAIEDSTWDNVLTYFGVGSDPSTRLTLPDGSNPLSIFLTATPERHDGRGLSALVDDVAFSYDILYGIRNGWLVDVRAYQVFDRSGADEPDFLYRIMKDYATGERTLYFARSVEESQMIADLVNDRGLLRAGHIDHQTDPDIRTQILEDFSSGDVDLLCNRLVLTEGYDNPAITQIIDNAPTQSRPLHIQKLGRGLRPSADAKIDTYNTPAERRDAIANSSKPWLTYVSTFDPTVHGLDMVATIWGRDQSVDAGGKLLVEEVIDVIEEIERDDPERPIQHIKSVDDIDIELREANIFDSTIRNENVIALTRNRWIMSDDRVSIYLTDNPIARADRSEGQYRGTPLIIEYTKNGSSWEGSAHFVGGWNGNRPTRAKTIELPSLPNPQRIVRAFDTRIEKYEDIAAAARRGGNHPASPEIIKYMKNKKIPFNEGVTQGVAQFLVDNYRISNAKVKK